MSISKIKSLARFHTRTVGHKTTTYSGSMSTLLQLRATLKLASTMVGFISTDDGTRAEVVKAMDLYSEVQISQLIRIGKKVDTFTKYERYLPAGLNQLYGIARMSEDEFLEYIKERKYEESAIIKLSIYVRDKI